MNAAQLAHLLEILEVASDRLFRHEQMRGELGGLDALLLAEQTQDFFETRLVQHRFDSPAQKGAASVASFAGAAGGGDGLCSAAPLPVWCRSRRTNRRKPAACATSHQARV